MSHRWDCPTDYEAEREGRRAAERGYSRYSNPYSDFGFQPCHEAEEHWQRGYRAGEREREEREAEERYQRQMDERRRQEAEEARYYEEQYYAQQEQYEEPTYPEPDLPQEGEPCPNQ